ncbi:MAG: hypothetical protein AA908_04630 [Chlorobi bacterium NICIL-2]|nr:MAG: hypothetical protein AA908_04630 [Chlorobi bacterium NICIL-2]
MLAVAVALGASACIIAMPMYHDHAIYWRGGERLLLGRPLADDYLVKQPGIYAIFAFSRAIFGEHEWSYRVVDAALQLFCAALLALVAFRSGGHLLAAAVCVLYLVTYSGSAFVLGSHPESYVGIPLALLVLLRTSSQQRPWHAVAEGMLYVLLVMLKITFGIVALGMLGWDLARRHAPRTLRARHWLGVASGALATCAILAAMFYRTIAWDTVPDTVEYLRFYASTPPISIAALLHAWHATLRVATENITVFSVAMAALGWLTIFSGGKDAPRRLVALLTLLLAASIIIERKFGIVHLWRILPMLAVFTAIGALHFASTLWNYWKSSPWALRAGVLVPLLLAAVALGPLPRFVYSLRIPLQAATNPTAYTLSFEQPAHNVLHRATLWEIAGYINSHRTPDERVLVLSACMAQLPLFLGEPEWYHFSTTMPIFSAHIPHRWRSYYEQDLHRADWLVVGTLDRAEFLFGHNRSSWEALQQDAPRWRYVQEHFDQVMETPIAIILHRRSPHVEQSRSER